MFQLKAKSSASLQETKELRQAAIKSNQLKRAQGYSKCKGLLW
jgi:hypothetical protein